MTRVDPASPARRQAWIAAAVASVVVVVGAVIFWVTRPQQTFTPAPAPAPITAGPTPSAQPSTTPKASATPSRTPSRTPSATPKPRSGNTAPATTGQLPAGFKLLHEGVPANDDTSAWELASWGYGCPSHVPVFASFSSLAASRNIEATGIEWAGSETILVFTTDAAATRFLSDLQNANTACAGPSDEPNTRTRTAADPFTGPWDAGVALRAWDEYTADSGATWTPRPGAALDLVVRRGRAVMISTVGGEYVGDPLVVGAAVNEARKAIDAAVGPMCAFTAGGC